MSLKSEVPLEPEVSLKPEVSLEPEVLLKYLVPLLKLKFHFERILVKTLNDVKELPGMAWDGFGGVKCHFNLKPMTKMVKIVILQHDYTHFNPFECRIRIYVSAYESFSVSRWAQIAI